MKSIWTIIPDYEEKFKVDSGKCRYIISNSKSIDDVRLYIESVLSRLKAGDNSIIKEAWSVAVPLAYRLAIDDTASNYRIASRIKEAVIWLDQPHLMSCIKEEIDWFVKTSYEIDYDKMFDVEADISQALLIFTGSLSGNWHVYSRIKSTSSIFDKFTRIRMGSKLPKNKNVQSISKTLELLNQFEEQVFQRINGDSANKKPYPRKSLEWILPDLVAFTIQFGEYDNFNRSLVGVKSKYSSVYRRLSLFPASIFYGPFYSKAWHMNRMVCYLNWQLDLFSDIPFELFVRTDLDYFIGYGNYWRYKGIKLFRSSEIDSVKYRRKILKLIRQCESFTKVQELLFEEITNGQLEIF